MQKMINEHGKEVWVEVTRESRFDADMFHEVDMSGMPEDRQWALHTNLGSLTVLDRMTGFGWPDTETGYRDPTGRFWLASGRLNVRDSGSKTIGEAIEWIKSNANNCIGE